MMTSSFKKCTIAYIYNTHTQKGHGSLNWVTYTYTPSTRPPLNTCMDTLTDAYLAAAAHTHTN